jgi:UDP-2,3-diacylglucosamine pyrophosphatase LpxH
MQRIEDMSIEQLRKYEQECRELLDECYEAQKRLRRPIFVISDLHMGDGGPRDNFAFGDREKHLLAFLDHVEKSNGRLVICGDLFELWQSNISKVLTHRKWLLDRLASMETTYILGNHDSDLHYFMFQEGWLSHPFFRRMCESCFLSIGGKSFQFIHGHEADPYCSSDVPGLGRITAIYSGIKEDRNGGPMLDEYRTVEQRVVGRMERFVSFWNWLRGKPDRFTEINRRLRDMPPVADVVISGHTHRPGHIDTWHYNAGTWAERTNSFLVISENGTVGVFDWVGDKAVPNDTELPI